jgi:3-dehydroquinate synthase
VITITSRVHDYAVHFEDDDRFLAGLDRFPQRVVVVDENVWRLHRQGCLRHLAEQEVMVFRVSEERKTLEGVAEVYDQLMQRAAKKNVTLVSIGGGIVQDVTGFVASSLYRGINWVFVPTTLLAQADSCVGSKTSLNYRRYKNLLGTFYPPKEVHIFSPFLGTLTEDDFRSGLGEVVKLHLMGGLASTALLGQELPALLRREPAPLLAAIHRSLAVKRSYMEGDEFDTGRRNLLNFGHCFGHALETTSDYAIPHGQAVVVGMLFANLAAVRRGLLREETAAALARELLLPSLSLRVRPAYLARAGVLEAMRQDKKRIGKDLVVVMLREDRELEKHTDFTEAELAQALEDLEGLLTPLAG